MWTTFQHVRDQDVPGFTNAFQTLCTKSSIKDSKKNLVLKHYGYLQKCIHDEMEFLDISLLCTAYRYVVKIENKLRKKKRDFGSVNLKQGKSSPKPQNKGQS